MTATQQYVMLALLSLDAYNRGANAMLRNIDDNWLGVQIGTAAYLYNSDEIDDAVAVGFSDAYPMGCASLQDHVCH